MSPLAVVPADRPQLPEQDAIALVRAAGVAGPAILGRRGYYRDTLGIVGSNDRGIYDDAILIVADGAYRTFNANTDPSISRTGIAVLKPGVYRYRLGIHNVTKDPLVHPHYLALVQASPVTVLRDGGAEQTGWFGINIHKGGRTTTSSEGCQTVHPDQWDRFIAEVQDVMHVHGLSEIPYVLTARDDLPSTGATA